MEVPVEVRGLRYPSTGALGGCVPPDFYLTLAPTLNPALL